MSRLSMSCFRRAIAESNRRAADSADADFRPDGVEDLASSSDRLLRSARELTRFTVSRKDDPRAVWREAQDVLREGLAGEEARQVLQVVRDIADSWLGLAEKVRHRWQAVEAACGVPERLDALSEAEREVAEVKAAAERMLVLVSGERPPIDAVLLQRGRSEVAEGRFRTAEEMRARLSTPKA